MPSSRSMDRCTDVFRHMFRKIHRCTKYKSLKMAVHLRARSLESDKQALNEELRQGEASSVGGPDG